MRLQQPVLGYFREKLDIEEFNFKSPEYEQAYRELIGQIEDEGVYVAVLMGQSSYLGDGIFGKHWALVEQDGSFVFEKRGQVEVDALWVKDWFDGDDIEQINTLEFRKLCSDKAASYEMLSDFQPKSILVENDDQATAAIDGLPGVRAVVKTLQGNSGEGVFVGQKDEFHASKFNHDFPWQVQEYIETDGGIPNVTSGRHDFRVVLLNGIPAIATLRTPPKGGLKSNLGYGGDSKIFGAEIIPKELLEICHAIDGRLAKFGQDRFYSADFGLTADGWRLFEVNAMPGTINRNRGEAAWGYQQLVAKFLAGVAKKYYEGGQQ